MQKSGEPAGIGTLFKGVGPLLLGLRASKFVISFRHLGVMVANRSAFDDARLCLVLSAAMLTIACGAAFAIVIGNDTQQSWGLLLLPAYLPIKYLFAGISNGPVVQMLSFVLIVVLSFGVYFALTFGLVCAYRHRHHS